jgi:ribosomal protein S14
MKHRRYLSDLKKRKNFKKKEIYYFILKILFYYFKNNFLKCIINKIVMFRKFNFCYKTRIRNYCVISGRSRGVYKQIKISRIVFRFLGSVGLFFGLTKSSW